MTRLLQEAVARLSTLPEEEQDRAAEILIAFSSDGSPYTLTHEQIAGVELAMQEADEGSFAAPERVREIFGRAL